MKGCFFVLPLKEMFQKLGKGKNNFCMKLTRKPIYTTHELLSQRNSIERTNKYPSVTSLNVSWNSKDEGDSDDNEKMK